MKENKYEINFNYSQTNIANEIMTKIASELDFPSNLKEWLKEVI